MSVKSGIKKNRNQVAMSALTLSLLAAYMAPAHALTTINDDVNVTGYAQIGTTTTGATASTGAGSGSTPPPPSTNNGNGTTTLYNISAYGASNVSSTSTTGGVLAEPSGNITGTGGSTTTSTSTWDVASYIIVASSNVSQVITTGSSMINMMNSTATVAGEGGNLIMSGNGSFGGNLYVDGTIIGGSNATGTPVLGDLTLKGGTNSTTVVLNDDGMHIATTGLPNGGAADSAKINSDDHLYLNSDANGGTVGDVIITKNNVTVASFGSYGLDMNGNNISGVNTITATTGNFTTVNATTVNATTGNITTINSTTINNSGTVNTSDLQATTATIGDIDIFDNVIGTENDLILRTNTDSGSTGAVVIEKQAYGEVARFDANNDGGSSISTNFMVDTNGATGNTTGTAKMVMSNNTASIGVQNAGGNLNGLTANSTGTVVRGGTNSSTLTLQENSAVLNSGASSSLSLTSNDAKMYGSDTAEIYNGSGTYFSAEGYNATAYANGASMHLNGYNADITNSYGSGLNTDGYNAYVYGYENAELYNGYGSGFEANQGNAYMTGSSQAVVTGGSSSMRLDSDGATFSGEGGSPIRVHGVADGKAKHDAVNVGQLDSAKNSLSGGIASIAAIANIPHVDPKKTFAIGVGYGNYDGQSGYAFGGSYRFMEDGVLKASVAGSDDGETAWGVGAGFSW